jgi:copper resistance protein C
MISRPLSRAPRALAVAGGLLLLAVATASSAAAHANLRAADPPADQTLATGPDRIRLTFTERPDPAGTGLTVLDGAGARVDLGNVAVSSAESSATVGLNALGPGVYTVAWTSRSLDDGDDAKGFFSFGVGAPVAAPIASIQGPGGANPGLATVDDLTISLSTPATVGQRALEVAVQSGGQPLVDAQRVQIRLSSPALDLGVATLAAAPQGDGRYVASTWLPTLPGSWQADVQVRREGRDDVLATFTLQL